MNIIGKWISADGLEFDIQGISEHLLSGRIRITLNQLVLDKIINAVILKNSPEKMIFCLYLEHCPSENYIWLGTFEEFMVNMNITKLNYMDDMDNFTIVENFQLTPARP